MAYPTFDLAVEQGVTDSLRIGITDVSGSIVDITGWTFTGTIKDSTNISLTPVARLEVDITEPLNGIITSQLTAQEAEKLVKTKYYYDIIGTKIDGTVVRIVQGKVVVNLGVTSLTDV